MPKYQIDKIFIILLILEKCSSWVKIIGIRNKITISNTLV